MKYRKKPIVIEAEQFHPDKLPLPFHERSACNLGPNGWYVVTAHGQETVIVAGDWIIPEPDGRGFYPCKPDIFEATYESADTTPAKTTDLTISVSLVDQAEATLPTLPATVSVTPNRLLIKFEGYGERTAITNEGWPVLVELYNGQPKVFIWADIKQEDPTHIVNLEDAAESKRPPD